MKLKGYASYTSSVTPCHISLVALHRFLLGKWKNKGIISPEKYLVYDSSARGFFELDKSCLTLPGILSKWKVILAEYTTVL